MPFSNVSHPHYNWKHAARYVECSPRFQTHQVRSFHTNQAARGFKNSFRFLPRHPQGPCWRQSLCQSQERPGKLLAFFSNWLKIVFFLLWFVLWWMGIPLFTVLNLGCLQTGRKFFFFLLWFVLRLKGLSFLGCFCFWVGKPYFSCLFSDYWVFLFFVVFFVWTVGG